MSRAAQVLSPGLLALLTEAWYQRLRLGSLLLGSDASRVSRKVWAVIVSTADTLRSRIVCFPAVCWRGRVSIVLGDAAGTDLHPCVWRGVARAPLCFTLFE